jgi:hypothetical protein
MVAVPERGDVTVLADGTNAVDVRRPVGVGLTVERRPTSRRADRPDGEVVRLPDWRSGTLLVDIRAP